MIPYLIPLLIFAVMWAVLIRPQKRKLRERAELVAAADVGHRIVTAGGIHGTVVRADGDLLGVEVAEGVVITIDRRAISEVPTLTSSPIDDNGSDR